MKINKIQIIILILFVSSFITFVNMEAPDEINDVESEVIKENPEIGSYHVFNTRGE